MGARVRVHACACSSTRVRLACAFKLLVSGTVFLTPHSGR